MDYCDAHEILIDPELEACPQCVIEDRDALLNELESMVFWMEDLLNLAREINRDLMRFYEPIKGWPAHIERLLAPTDHDTALAKAKELLQD